MAHLRIHIQNTGHSVLMLIVSVLTGSCNESEIVGGDISQSDLIEQIVSDNAPIILDVRTPENILRAIFLEQSISHTTH